MSSNARLSWSVLGAALLGALAIAWAPGARGAACPVPAPVLTGPDGVQAGESYSLSWTNVLTSAAAQSADYYVVERSQDANFASGVDQIVTLRSAITLTPGAASAKILYHRITVKSSCPTASPAAIVSNVVAVPVKSTCDAPLSVGELHVDPSNPPAYSTWVVTWNTLGSGPGPGGGPTGLKFHIRRTSAFEPDGREWVVDGGAASFSGAPGDYVFQVWAEASCGSLGPWSPSLRVTVGNVMKPALLLVSEPAPIAALVPAAGTRLTTSFVVRNGGTDAIAVRAMADYSGFLLAPDSFALGPNAETAVVVTSLYVSVLERPVHASVVLTAGETTLTGPVDCMFSAVPAKARVVWSDPAADNDRDGNPVLRSIVNPSDVAASFVATVRAPWLTVVALDGQSWDRPLAARETRTVQLVVDRAKRRSGTGTEVGAVSLATVGFPDGVETLLVTDDGPAVPATVGGTGATPATAARTRLLYAAFPNAVDAKNVGRFAADLWLTNSDAVNAVPVSLLFNPIGGPSDGSALPRYAFTLAAAPADRHRPRQHPAAAGHGGDVHCGAPRAPGDHTGDRTVRIRNAADDPGRGREAERSVVLGVGPRARRESPLESASPRDVGVRHANPRRSLRQQWPSSSAKRRDREHRQDDSRELDGAAFRRRGPLRSGASLGLVCLRADHVEGQQRGRPCWRRTRVRRGNGDGDRQSHAGLVSSCGCLFERAESAAGALLERTDGSVERCALGFTVRGRSALALVPRGSRGRRSPGRRVEAVLEDADHSHEHVLDERSQHEAEVRR